MAISREKLVDDFSAVLTEAEDLLKRAANESGIGRPTFKSFRVRFPSTARMPEMANVRTDRSNRWIYMVMGSRKVKGQGSRSAVTAIIVTVEGRQIVHVRRVHSR